MATSDNQGQGGSAPDDKAGAAGAGAGDKGAGAGSANNNQGASDKGGAGAGAGAGDKGGAGEGDKGAGAGTLAGGAEPKKDVPGAPPKFPDDWRQQLSSGDAKELARLERFGSIQDVYKSYRALEAKISSGELKSVATLPANATDEQKAEFRKSQGIPETPEKYDTALGKGLVIGEADKPIVATYLKYAHDQNLTPAQVKQNLEWYFETQQAEKQARAGLDSEYKIQSVEAMKEEWGGDYKPNLNRIRGLLNTFPEKDVNRLLGGYTADGRVVGDDPGVLRILNQLAREVDPAGSVVPGSSNAPAAIQDERVRLEKMMGNKRSEYWNGPKAAENQERYRQLVEAQEKIKGRTAA